MTDEPLTPEEETTLRRFISVVTPSDDPFSDGGVLAVRRLLATLDRERAASRSVDADTVRALREAIVREVHAYDLNGTSISGIEYGVDRAFASVGARAATATDVAAGGGPGR